MIEFFAPVSKKVIAHREVLPEGVLGKTIELHTKKGELPSLDDARFALIGVLENRNDTDFIGEDINLDAFRQSLYSLYPGNWKKKIVDLGDIEKGDTVEDSYFALRTVVEALLEIKVIPVSYTHLTLPTIYSV